MASLEKLMLEGNYNEEYICGIRDDIENVSFEYRGLFSKCSEYIENMMESSLDGKIKKGIGSVSDKLGKVIGNIPVIKEGFVDEYFIAKGVQLKKDVNNAQLKTIESFSELSNPETNVFINCMNDMVMIFNHTSEILVDNDNLYLVAER